MLGRSVLANYSLSSQDMQGTIRTDDEISVEEENEGIKKQKKKIERQKKLE